MRNLSARLCAIGLVLALVPWPSAGAQPEQEVIYKTGFEPPDFEPGPLMGQDEWFALLNVESAEVSPEFSRRGEQGVFIDGSRLEETMGFYMTSFVRMLNYDPVGNGLPKVRIVGDINLTTGEDVPPTCGIGVGFTGQKNGEYVANVLAGVRKRRGKLVSYISNLDGVSKNGPRYGVGKWARVRLEANFKTRMVRGFFNGDAIGKVPFSEGTNGELSASNIFIGSREPIPDVLALFDELAVKARTTKS